jgi:predicted PurR-regulated permease PerM
MWSDRLGRIGKGCRRALGIVALVAVPLYVPHRFGGFITPSVVGIVLATTLSPVVGWMERRRVPRLLCAMLVSVVIV